MQDRRTKNRLRAFFPITFDSDSRSERIAMSRDASEKGILFGTPSRLEVGEEVSLNFRILPGAPMAAHTGRVVRAERSDTPAHALWRYLVAVELDSTLAGNEVNALQEASSRPIYATNQASN